MGTPKWNPGAVVAAAAVAAALAGMASATEPGRNGAQYRLRTPCDSAARGRNHSCRMVGWDFEFSPNAPDSTTTGNDTVVVWLGTGAVYAAPTMSNTGSGGTVVVSQPVLAGSVPSTGQSKTRWCTGGRRRCEVVLPRGTTTLIIGYGDHSAIRAVVSDSRGRRGCQVTYHLIVAEVDSVTSTIGRAVSDTLNSMKKPLGTGHPNC